MAHELSKLPYPQNALEPRLSSTTLEYHYGKHHKGYVNKLNQLIVGTEFEKRSLLDTVMKSAGAIFNNAAQAWNHDFYWKSLTPESVSPSAEFSNLLGKRFGSLEGFHKVFKEAAAGVFGSGWAWLVVKEDQGLDILTTPNADNPLKHGLVPLLTVDVWEHAYYIDYRNERAKYLDALSQIMNWKFAESNLAEYQRKLAA